jgi:hypothetical protein
MSLLINIDLASPDFLVELPNGSHVRVPATQKGAEALYKMLVKQRQPAGPHHNKTASPTVPTQYRVDRFLSGQSDDPTAPPVKRLAPRTRKISFEVSLEELGL